MPIFPSPRFYSSLTLSLSITPSIRPHSGFCCHDSPVTRTHQSPGQPSPLEITNCLLKTVSEGTFQRDQFIMECNLNSDRFHQPLKKLTVLTFASFKKKIKISGKVHEVIRLVISSISWHEYRLWEITLFSYNSYAVTTHPLSKHYLRGSIDDKEFHIFSRQ